MKTSILRAALAWLAVVLLVPTWLVAEETHIINGKKVVIHDNVVDLFDGMKSGDLEVRFIPHDAKQANVLIENKTGKPVTIRLPEAFAGVPALGQIGGLGGGGLGGAGLGGGGLGGGLGGGGLGGGGNQGLGGGFGGGGFGGGGFGGGGGFFNVAPDKIGKIKVATVCLEHGKNDPNPRIKYTIVPIESFTDKPEVIEVCKMLGRGEITQNTAQAAAWHLANGLSWQELAAKDRVFSTLTGYREKFFSLREIQVAIQIAAEANRRAELLARERSAHPIESENPYPTSLRN